MRNFGRTSWRTFVPNLFLYWAKGSRDVIYFLFLFLATILLAKQNHLCNFGRGQYEENLCEFGYEVHEELLKDLSFLTLGGNFVQQRGTICVIWKRALEGTFRRNYFAIRPVVQEM